MHWWKSTQKRRQLLESAISEPQALWCFPFLLPRSQLQFVDGQFMCY